MILGWDVIMKKKLLFISQNLECGGVERSLINLLSVLDYEKYDVDLVLLRNKGIFLNSLPSGVNLLPQNNKLALFSYTLTWDDAISMFKVNKDFTVLLDKLKVAIANRIAPIIGMKNYQLSWKIMSKSIKPISKEYDAAIAFLIGPSMYYLIEKVNAKKKIVRLQTDYSKLDVNLNFDQKYFEKADYIMAVSEITGEILSKFYPFIKDKIKVVHSILLPETIKKLSFEKILIKDNFDGIKIVTMARLSNEKGIDLAIKACSRLINEGYNVKWYFLGSGTEKNLERYKSLANELNVQSNIEFLGAVDNPYPYVRIADIYVQPSRFEGRSNALNEAKALNKPIVVTNYPTVRDQIIDKVEGIIVPVSAEGISEGVKKLIENPDKMKNLSMNLEKTYIGNEYEISKFYKLIED